MFFAIRYSLLAIRSKASKNMCGIVAYLGAADAYPKLIKGLKRLEYRGYDSSGVALHNGDLLVYKKKERSVTWKPMQQENHCNPLLALDIPAGPPTVNPMT